MRAPVILIIMTLVSVMPHPIIAGNPDSENTKSEKQVISPETDIPPFPLYDPTRPTQARIDYMTVMQVLVNSAVYSYFRENRVLPESLDELNNSGWMWFDPAPADIIPEPILVEREVQPIEGDLNAIEVVFYPDTGYDFAYVLPETDEPDEDSYEVYRWPHNSLIASYQRRMSMFGTNSPFNDDDLVNIRLQQMQNICETLFAGYFQLHATMPSSLSDLLESRQNPRDEIFEEFPIIPIGEAGSFYMGFNPERRILFIQYVTANNQTVNTQKIYGEVPSRSGRSGPLGQNLGPAEKIEMEETIMLISSELPGWGFIDL